MAGPYQRSVAARDVLGGPIVEPQQRNPFLAPMHGSRSSRRAAHPRCRCHSHRRAEGQGPAGAGERPRTLSIGPGARRSRHQLAADRLGRLAAGPPHRQSGPPRGSPRRPAGQGAKGLTRRIDAAVAAVMAVHRAVELAGAREPSIYIRSHYDPGERLPGVVAWAMLRWELGPRVDGCLRAQGRCPPIDLRRNVTSMASITCQAGERSRPW